MNTILALSRTKNNNNNNDTDDSPAREQTHNPLSTRSLMKKIYDEQFSNIADYDCIVQIQFRDVEQFIAMKNDPVYKSTIFADHKKFADTTRSK